MKKNLLSLLLVAFCSYMMSNAQVVLLTHGQESKQPWTAKYMFAANKGGETPPSNWFQVDFDETEWDSIVGPISTRYSLDYYETTWGNLYSTYWLRRHFTLEKASDIRALDLMLNNDDDMEIYLNGKMLYQPKQLNRRTKLVEFSENVPSLLRDGDNVVAVRISDSAGGDAFVDFGMTGYAEPKKYFALHHSVDSLSTILAKDLSLANPTAVSEAKAFLEQTKSDMEAFVYDDADAEEQTVMIDWMISRVTNKYLAINVSVPGGIWAILIMEWLRLQIL